MHRKTIDVFFGSTGWKARKRSKLKAAVDVARDSEERHGTGRQEARPVWFFIVIDGVWPSVVNQGKGAVRTIPGNQRKNWFSMDVSLCLCLCVCVSLSLSLCLYLCVLRVVVVVVEEKGRD